MAMNPPPKTNQTSSDETHNAIQHDERDSDGAEIRRSNAPQRSVQARATPLLFLSTRNPSTREKGVRAKREEMTIRQWQHYNGDRCTHRRRRQL